MECHSVVTCGQFALDCVQIKALFQTRPCTSLDTLELTRETQRVNINSARRTGSGSHSGRIVHTCILPKRIVNC